MAAKSTPAKSTAKKARTEADVTDGLRPRRTPTKKAPAAKAVAKKAPAAKKALNDAAITKAHGAVLDARDKVMHARARRAEAETTTTRKKADAAVAAARATLADAMTRRQAVMVAYRDAGGRVVDLQALCGFSSSGATLFALKGGK